MLNDMPKQTMCSRSCNGRTQHVLRLYITLHLPPARSIVDASVYCHGHICTAAAGKPLLLPVYCMWMYWQQQQAVIQVSSDMDVQTLLQAHPQLVALQPR